MLCDVVVNLTKGFPIGDFDPDAGDRRSGVLSATHMHDTAN